MAIVILATGLAGCKETPVEDSSSESSSISSGESDNSDISEAQLYTHKIIVDLTYTSNEVRDITIENDKKEMTVEDYALELSKHSGLDFFVTARQEGKDIYVDWAKNSTLIAGLDDRPQKEDFFHFYDFYSLAWFMMDSLWQTILKNYDAENVYYTMDGGKELEIADISTYADFPVDSPYMGYRFYEEHINDNSGDTESFYKSTAGMWRADGKKDAEYIVMNGTGAFMCYSADGSIEAMGTLDYADDSGDGKSSYIMNVNGGDVFGTFVFESETQIRLGSEPGTVYILDKENG